MAYEASLADDAEPVRALTFQAEKQEPRGWFHEVTRYLFIAVAMSGPEVKYAAGDLNDIERFNIPPEIKRAIVEFMSPGREMATMGAGRRTGLPACPGWRGSRSASVSRSKPG